MSKQIILISVTALLMFIFMGFMNYKVIIKIRESKISINCPQNWTYHNNQCFGPKFSEVSLYEALEECDQENATLVSIHNADENALVLRLLESQEGWISALRTPLETWVWADRSAWDFETWATDAFKEDKGCLKMTTSSGWIASDCDERLSAFICRADVATTVQPIETVNATGGFIPQSPESFALISFIFLPGICLCLVSLYHILCPCRVRCRVRFRCRSCYFPWTIFKSFILAIIPTGLFGIIVYIWTNVIKEKCEMCRLSDFLRSCCCGTSQITSTNDMHLQTVSDVSVDVSDVSEDMHSNHEGDDPPETPETDHSAFTLCPFHGDLLWFERDDEDSELENKEKRKKMMMDLYCSSTSLYYGAVLSLCLNSYILLQTPSGGVPFSTQISIMLGIYPLVKTPYNLLFANNDDKEKKQLISKLKKIVSVHFCCCCRQEEEEEEEEEVERKNRAKRLKKNCRIMKNSVKGDICSLYYSIENVILSLTKFWLCKCCCCNCQKEDKEKAKKGGMETFMKRLEIIGSALLLFTNSLFNIGTLVVMFSYCKRVGNIWLSSGLPIGYAILLFVIYFTTEHVKHFSRLAMAWCNMFVFSLPLRKNSKKNIQAAVKVQVVHHFINIIALPFCVFTRPKDYIFVPDLVIWPYFVFGWFSLLVLFVWLVKLEQELELVDVTNDTLHPTSDARSRAQFRRIDSMHIE